MLLLSDHQEMNAQKTTLVKKNFDSNTSNSSTRKESIEEGIEEEDDEELVAKTSYVVDLSLIHI